jgi:hypothetical protein
MPHRRPGWILPNGHIVRSNAEAALCDFFGEMEIGHEHWKLVFDLPVGDDQHMLFIPALHLTGVRQGERTVLIQPLDSVARGSGVRRMQMLRRRHGREYCVVVVARRPLHAYIPPDAYDHVFPLEEFQPLLTFVRGLYV